jgi:hypothetical protein
MATNDDDGPKTITVSREALRAELLALELRLTEKLVAKGEFVSLTSRFERLESRVEAKIAWADGLMPLRDKLIEEHKEMKTSVEQQERGELTDAQLQKITSIIAAAFQQRSKQGWTSRERWMGIFLFVIAAATITLNTVLAYHNWAGK